jgi:hypothetical protein
MSRDTALKHEFVEFIPEDLREGSIYVSIRFATASHKCCCGCGHKVVTPITPTDWKLIFDGKTISLDPSIGNWSFACQSHYWIRNNRVQWADKWSKDNVAAGRAHDQRAKLNYFDAPKPELAKRSGSNPAPPQGPGLWQRVRHWWQPKSNRSGEDLGRGI